MKWNEYVYFCFTEDLAYGVLFIGFISDVSYLPETIPPARLLKNNIYMIFLWLVTTPVLKHTSDLHVIESTELFSPV